LTHHQEHEQERQQEKPTEIQPTQVKPLGGDPEIASPISDVPVRGLLDEITTVTHITQDTWATD